MVEFINKYTGSLMRVADNRKEEYLEAGHKLASIPKKAEEPKKEPAKKTKKS